MGNVTYAESYRNIDFRKYPEQYKIGRGEQGVLIAQPYKSEILPHWKFATLAAATKSAKTIFGMFNDYAQHDDFVGMDMARKFLQMGFTRARRYANHATGSKYNKDGSVKPQAKDWETSEKAKAAKVFYKYYSKAKADKKYLQLKKKHLSS
jgi:hypothetical protein